MSNIIPFETESHHRYVAGGETARDIRTKIRCYTKYTDTLLLTGETGVGKDLIAREIHRYSLRKNNPFLSVPLTSLTPSLFESELFGHERGAFTGADQKKIGILEAADGGTLYFPEISELPEYIQLKLLEFIQYRAFRRVGHNPKQPEITVDVCLIFASNENLEHCVAQNKLRKDFYYRINKHCIDIPPLRERRDEIGPLAEHFAKVYGKRLFGKEVNISREAIELLKQYHWPGNVRELRNVIEKTLVNFANQIQDGYPDAHLTEELFLTYLDGEGVSSGSSIKSNGPHSLSRLINDDTDMPAYEKAKHIFKRLYFNKLLKRTGGDIRKASVTAGLTERGLRKILKEIGINNGVK